MNLTLILRKYGSDEVIASTWVAYNHSPIRIRIIPEIEVKIWQLRNLIYEYFQIKLSKLISSTSIWLGSIEVNI